MEKLSRLCRVCLTENIQYNIENTQFQAVYEKLSGMPLQTNNMRPLSVCFICYTQLNKARNLMVKCLKAEEILTLMQTQLLDIKKEVDYEPTLNDMSLYSPQLSISITEHNNIEPEVEDIDIKQELLYKKEAEISSLTTAQNELDTDIKQETPYNQIDDILPHLSISATEQTNIDSELQMVIIKQEIEELDDEEESLISSSNTALSGVAVNIKKEITKVVETESLQSACKLEGINIKEEIVYGEDDAENTIYSPEPTSTALCQDVNKKNFPYEAFGIPSKKQVITKDTWIATIKKREDESVKGTLVAEKPKYFLIIQQPEVASSAVNEKTKQSNNKISNQFTCSVCEKGFTQKTNLDHHARIHSNKKPFLCNVCNKEFISKGNLKIHTGKKPYPCNVCEKSFNSPSHLKEHIRIHTGTPVEEHPNIVLRITKSKIENSTKPKNEHKNLHKRKKINVILYNCNVCQSNFKSRSSLKEHIRTHTAEKFDTRDHKSIKEESRSKKHTGTDTVVKPYACDLCGKNFITKLGLERHIQAHNGDKPYSCDICPARFSYKGNLYRHIVTHSGEKRFYCSVCYKKFNRKGNLIKHLRVHIGERTSTFHLHPISLGHMSAKRYPCDICHKRFNEQSGLKEHIRTHTGEKPYTCDVCNKSFISKSKIKLHIRTHTGEKPYVCNICNKSFNENSKLRLHIRIHTGEKPYTCGVCQKSFNRKAHLKGHTRIHTGDTPYTCKMCQKRYTDSCGLKRHIETHAKTPKRSKKEKSVKKFNLF